MSLPEQILVVRCSEHQEVEWYTQDKQWTGAGCSSRPASHHGWGSIQETLHFTAHTALAELLGIASDSQLVNDIAMEHSVELGFFFKEITICGIIFKKLVTVTSLYQFSDYCSFPNCMRMQVHRKNKMSLWTKNMMFCGRFEKALPADALSQITSSTNRSFMCHSLPPHEFTWSNFVSLRWYLQSVWKKRESCVTAVINIPKST